LSTLSDKIIAKMKFGERGSFIISEELMMTAPNLPDLLKPAIDKAFELDLEIMNEFAGVTRAIKFSWRPKPVRYNLIAKYGPINGWYRQTMFKEDADEFPIIKTETEKYIAEVIADIKYEAKLLGIELLIEEPKWVDDYEIDRNLTWTSYIFRWTQAKTHELEKPVVE
jgi:hypothetical protein